MTRDITRRSMLKTTAAIGAASALPMIPFAAEAGDDIIVGGLHDLSGFIDFAGIPMNQIMLMAIEEINAAGGLLGKKLKGAVYDPQTKMPLYSQFATQLALKDKASVVMGGITSASRETIRPILHRYKTLYFYNTLYEGGVCDRNEISLGTTPAQTVEKLVPYSMGLWGKKVYTIAADYNYGQITAAWVKRYVEQNGGEVVSTDFFPLDVTNFGPTISKIQSAKPDMVMSVLVGTGHLGFYNQWAAAGMKNEIPIASTTFGAAGAELEILKPEVANGILTCYGYYPSIAKRWAVGADKRTVYFELDPDARYSDGEPVRVTDFFFHFYFMRSKHIKAPWYNDYYDNKKFKNITLYDTRTLSITYYKAKPDVVEKVSIRPVPEHH